MQMPFPLPSRLGAGDHDALLELAVAQEGIARRDQVLRLGVSAHVVEAMVSAARWRARGDQVLVLHNGPLTNRQELWAAVLNCPPPVGLAARTAAADYGLKRWPSDSIEILVPRGARVPRGLGLGVRVHESRRFTAADLNPARALPAVRVERALVDAATWSRTPRAACGILAAGVQQRLTTSARLQAEIALTGKIRYRSLMIAALVDIAGGAQAVSEIDFLRFCARNGIPAPQLQQVRAEPSGRRRYLDATFRRRDGKLVRVEIDGALHLVVQTYWADMSRGNELVIGHERVLRFPSFVIYANDAEAVDQLRRALDLSGAEPAIAG